MPKLLKSKRFSNRKLSAAQPPSSAGAYSARYCLGLRSRLPCSTLIGPSYASLSGPSIFVWMYSEPRLMYSAYLQRMSVFHQDCCGNSARSPMFTSSSGTYSLINRVKAFTSFRSSYGAWTSLITTIRFAFDTHNLLYYVFQDLHLTVNPGEYPHELHQGQDRGRD